MVVERGEEKSVVKYRPYGRGGGSRMREWEKDEGVGGSRMREKNELSYKIKIIL